MSEPQRPADAGGAALARVLGTRDDPKQITSALAFAAQHFHLVSPATTAMQLPVGTSVALASVLVDVDGETYDVGFDPKTKQAKHGLGKDVLFRIAAAMGVDWDPPRRMDDRSQPDYWEYEAVGWLRGFDGARERIVGSKTLDLREGSSTVESIVDRCRGTLRKRHQVDTLAPAHEAEAQESARKQIRDMRLFGDRHAATKAMLAAIRTRVRGVYPKSELAKPFVVARLAWTGAGLDPAHAAELTFEAMTGARRTAYPQASAQVPAPRPAPRYDVPDAAFEVADLVAPPSPPPSPPPSSPPRRTPAPKPASGCEFESNVGIACPQSGNDPEWWCSACKAATTAAIDGAPAAASPAPPPANEPTLPFGRSKGKRVSEAADEDLRWIIGALEKSIADPEKARYRASNETLRDAAVDELTRRGGQ